MDDVPTEETQEQRLHREEQEGLLRRQDQELQNLRAQNQQQQQHLEQQLTLVRALMQLRGMNAAAAPAAALPNNPFMADFEGLVV